MLMSTVCLLPPAIARLPLPIPSQGFLYGAADLFLVAGLAHDLASRRRVHPAFAWGGAGMVASQALWISISGTSTWLRVAAWIIGRP